MKTARNKSVIGRPESTAANLPPMCVRISTPGWLGSKGMSLRSAGCSLLETTATRCSSRHPQYGLR